ncbi:CBS domain-containing protein [Nocardioides marinus]|nr:CBS domain-containing protein [Nocardioides marinus]
MPLSDTALLRFLNSVHPYDSLPPVVLRELAPKLHLIEAPAGTQVYALGENLDGLYLVHTGEVEVTDENGIPVSNLGPRNSFGERGLTRGGRAVTSAVTTTDSLLLLLPAADFHGLMASQPKVARFFDRRRPGSPANNTLATMRVADIMSRPPVTCPVEQTCQGAAQLMRDQNISSVCVAQRDQLKGILTTRDLTSKLLAQGWPATTPVADVMSRDPLTLSPSALGSEVLQMMMEHGIGHIPVVQGDALVGIVTQTDLTRFQAVNSGELVLTIARAASVEDMARATAEIPRLLVQLVAAGNRHEVVTRLITDIADSVTRRLLALAENTLGPPPVPYLWLACGSQGRREQTGVTDQDNCLILADGLAPGDDAYFAQLAQIVCDGLHHCGYIYCPGDMMATNARWRQPVHIWRSYFRNWIARPDPEAQMLASVMFDLRPIGGDHSLYGDLQGETLGAARQNSIFTAHMVANSLKHQPPLGLLRGLATIRSGEHRNTLDMKHNGVVPVVDLGRIYALTGAIHSVNTRARLEAAAATGLLSLAGAQDLLDAYDLIAQTRLEHQAQQIRSGEMPDNYLAPSDLSDLERSHLRDAFVVVKTMQSAVGYGRRLLN